MNSKNETHPAEFVMGMYMLADIDDKKITAFRDLVNDNNQFVLKTYANKQGKNQWNLICSSMDWISVAIRNLHRFPDLDSNIDVRVMQIYSLISSIDIVNEAVKQLHRVFFGHSTKLQAFKGEKLIFNERIFDKDDNDYFKEVRACFGAHPVNLDGEGKEKRFASWPYEGFTKSSSDLEVRLYSNDPNKDDIVLGLNIKELVAFLQSRYEYLDNISLEIERQYELCKQELALTPIADCRNMRESIDILLKENESRFNNDHYRSTLEELALLLSTHLYEAELAGEALKFKNSLVPLIEELRQNLQDVNIVDLHHDDLLNPTSSIESTLHYELPKFYSCVLGQLRYKDPLFEFYLKRINEVSSNKYQLKVSDSDGQLLLKLKLIMDGIS
ncbi:hypothetical protein H5202_18375 [Shewanella sp. SG41-4]|uniref:hypothetical protein n=1 Tax=Shewanella sp. SG41-4 TaxID=2760976 RepID=UPI0016024426|nr:hypothetical protein [Shewanella sp. SG41-4]MBB1440603.1 hypothetical protein [Shewanella sp. SG41-4]